MRRGAARRVAAGHPPPPPTLTAPPPHSPPPPPPPSARSVQGFSADGSKIVPSAAPAPYAYEAVEEKYVAPSGDVPWEDILWKGTARKAGQDAGVAARLLDYVRAGAAGLMGEG